MEKRHPHERAIVLASLSHLASDNPIPESVQREVSPFRTFRLRREDVQQVRASYEQPKPDVDELLGNVTLDDAMRLIGLVNTLQPKTRAQEGEHRRLVRFVNRLLGLLRQPQRDEIAS